MFIYIGNVLKQPAFYAKTSKISSHELKDCEAALHCYLQSSQNSVLSIIVTLDQNLIIMSVN